MDIYVLALACSTSTENSGQYPLSCPVFKTQRFEDWILSLSSGGTYPETETSSIDWNQLSRFHLKTETECSLQNLVF
jgi:hypothetical protein